MQERRLRVEGEIWRIMTVYNGIRMKDLKKIIESKIEELEEGILCIGGDFNDWDWEQRGVDGREKRTRTE